MERLEPQDIGGISDGLPEDLEYRKMTLTGKLFCSQAVLVRNRTLNGRPGYWVFAPFEYEALSPALLEQDLPRPPVMVNLGWLPREFAEVEEGALPAWQGDNCRSQPAAQGQGAVSATVTGLVFSPEDNSGRECASLSPTCTFAGANPEAFSEHYLELFESESASSTQTEFTSGLPWVFRPGEAPVERSFYLQLEESAPFASANLAVLGAPEFSLGNHRSYAVQWFIFSSIFAGGYPLILWRHSKKRALAGQRSSSLRSSSLP